MYEENNKNNTGRQVLLSVLAVAILVVAVVGVSLAFFQYSRQGTTTNTINTGSLVFRYTEKESGITLDNALPMSDATVTGGTVLNGANEYFEFDVHSEITGAMNIKYQIGIVEETDQDELKTLESKYVKVRLLKEDEKLGTYLETAVSPTYFDKLQPLDLAGVTNTDGKIKKLYEDTFTGTGNHFYKFQMWVSDKDSSTAETMMQNDACTANGVASENCACATGKKVSELQDDACKLTTRGTNGKTFSVRLNVYAVDQKPAA